LESRDQRAELNRNLAKKHYQVNFEMNQKESSENIQLKETRNKAYTSAKYNYINTGRIFRPIHQENSSHTDILKIYFTLIEYGYNKDASFQKTLLELLKKKKVIEENKNQKPVTVINPTNLKSNLTSVDAKKEEKEEVINISAEDQKKLDEVINSNVMQVENKLQKIKSSVIEDIFSENLENIISEIEKFENLKEDENVDRIKLFLKEKERLEKVKSLSISQAKDLETELNQTNYLIEGLKREINQIYNEMSTINNNINNNTTNIKKLNDKIKSEKVSEEKIAQLEEKFKTKEEIKQNMAKFKKDCLEEKKVYDTQLKNLEKKSERLNDSENEQIFGEIDKNYQEEVDNLIVTKKDLFEQNKIINLLSRKIQVFPSKLELIQYQKRFQELYEQINKISEKSRNLLNEINSREEIKKLLTQKVINNYLSVNFFI